MVDRSPLESANSFCSKVAISHPSITRTVARGFLDPVSIRLSTKGDKIMKGRITKGRAQPPPRGTISATSYGLYVSIILFIVGMLVLISNLPRVSTRLSISGSVVLNLFLYRNKLRRSCQS